MKKTWNNNEFCVGYFPWVSNCNNKKQCRLNFGNCENMKHYAVITNSPIGPCSGIMKTKTVKTKRGLFLNYNIFNNFQVTRIWTNWNTGSFNRREPSVTWRIGIIFLCIVFKWKRGSYTPTWIWSSKCCKILSTSKYENTLR